uniref:Ribosomal protein L19 n=1 Tax=Bornetia secundiflora TaxID=2575637 RepID=A0A4D6WTF2_9FLOR|nr:ribosomal protein L19 [Bornetia secundiflora]
MITNQIKYSDIIAKVENKFKKSDLPEIEVGDSIKIKLIIQEGTKERIQIIEGVVISKKNTQLNKAITIRKIIHNIGVERIYLLHSTRILNIEILKKAKVRKAKLYYLRYRSGKATRLKQKFK